MLVAGLAFIGLAKIPIVSGLIRRDLQTVCARCGDITYDHKRVLTRISGYRPGPRPQMGVQTVRKISAGYAAPAVCYDTRRHCTVILPI
jgi:hypothetical protein